MRLIAWLLTTLLFSAPALAADIAFRAHSVNSSDTATTLSCTAPTGTVAGDGVLAVVGHNGQETIADNNGATPFTLEYESWDTGAPFGATLTVFYRVIQSGDPASYSFTADTSGRMTVLCVTFSDPNTTTFFDKAPVLGSLTVDTTNDGSSTAVDITTLSDKAIHVLPILRDSSISPVYGALAGYTQLGTGAGGVGEATDLYYKTIAVAGATGAQSISATGGEFLVQSFALKNNVPAASTAPSSLSLMGVGR